MIFIPYLAQFLNIPAGLVFRRQFGHPAHPEIVQYKRKLVFPPFFLAVMILR
jgi:hypothetical protein